MNNYPKINQIVILAGGLATRIRPISETVPKSMIEVAGKPFIAHQLELIKNNGIRSVVICASHLGEQILEFVGDGEKFGLKVDYSFDGDKLLGTGGAILNAINKLDPVFFLMYGDSYLNTDFKVINEYFFSRRLPALMAVYKNEGRWEKSNVRFEHGQIIEYSKTKFNVNMKHIDYGLGILSVSCLEEFQRKSPFDLADLYRNLIEKKDLAGFEVKERFYEIGSFEGLKETDRYLKNQFEI